MSLITHTATPWIFHNRNTPEYIDIDGACGTRITSVSLDVSGTDFNKDDPNDTPENEIAISKANAAYIVKACNRYEALFEQFQALLNPQQNSFSDNSAALELLCRYLREDELALNPKSQSYLSEFPNFGLMHVSLPEEFEDVSWEKEDMPCFIRRLNNGEFLRLLINYPDVKKRANIGSTSFDLSLCDKDHEHIRNILATNDYQAICNAIEVEVKSGDSNFRTMVKNQNLNDTGKSSYLTVFPDFGLMHVTIPDGFTDVSNHQDNMPCFERELLSGRFLRLWINWKDKDKRVFDKSPGYELAICDEGRYPLEVVAMFEDFDLINSKINQLLICDTKKELGIHLVSPKSSGKFRIFHEHNSGSLSLSSIAVFDSEESAQSVANSFVGLKNTSIVEIGSMLDKVICKNIVLQDALNGIADAAQNLFNSVNVHADDKWCDLDGWITCAREVA